VSEIRFVALGDSITVGLGDQMPDRSWRGWAALLAQSLPGEVEFHNLAELGAQTHTAINRQLPVALDLRPTIAAAVIGVNDTLRGSFDLARTGRAMHELVQSLHRTGALILTCALPDPGRMFGLPRPLARQLARRIRAVNAVTNALAAQYGTVHFDAANHPDTYERRMWSVDRLHPSERGHRLLARSFAAILRERGMAAAEVDAEPTNPSPTRLASVRWLATKGTAWVLDRSTDLVPHLVGLSMVEFWHGLRGLTARLDQRIGADILTAVEAIEGGSDGCTDLEVAAA
jgi:lysophospholipase L1-like esterase